MGTGSVTAAEVAEATWELELSKRKRESSSSSSSSFIATAAAAVTRDARRLVHKYTVDNIIVRCGGYGGMDEK